MKRSAWYRVWAMIFSDIDNRFCFVLMSISPQAMYFSLAHGKLDFCRNCPLRQWTSAEIARKWNCSQMELFSNGILRCVWIREQRYTLFAGNVYSAKLTFTLYRANKVHCTKCSYFRFSHQFSRTFTK